MEKVKIKTKNDSSFRGRLFAKFAANKKFNQYLDDHIVEPPINNISNAGQAAMDGGKPKRKFSSSPDSWRCRLVTPESVVGSTKSSLETVSTAYDQDSLYSAAYHDVAYGYSTESVPKLIEKERKQLEQEAKLEKLKQRRASKDSIPPMIVIPKDLVVMAPTLAEVDETGVPPIRINVNRSSDSPEPKERLGNIYALDPHSSDLIDRKRRASTPFLGFNSPPSLDPMTRMPMMRCPSCLHLSTTPSATMPDPDHSHAHSLVACANTDEDAKALKRVQSLCGLLPSDFTPMSLPFDFNPKQNHEPQSLQHHPHPRRTTLSPSPSRCEDSGYDNSMATDSLMTDSALMGNSLTPSIIIKSFKDNHEDVEDDEDESSKMVVENGKLWDKE